MLKEVVDTQQQESLAQICIFVNITLIAAADLAKNVGEATIYLTDVLKISLKSMELIQRGHQKKF
jgi:hypothetical protein